MCADVYKLKKSVIKITVVFGVAVGYLIYKVNNLSEDVEELQNDMDLLWEGDEEAEL